VFLGESSWKGRRMGEEEREGEHMEKEILVSLRSLWYLVQPHSCLDLPQM